jgi:tetratricopeptide (TPR) repeat protein
MKTELPPGRVLLAAFSTAVTVAIVTLGIGCGRGNEPSSNSLSSSTDEHQIEIQSAINSGQYARADALLKSADVDTTTAVHAFLRGRLAERTGFREQARYYYELTVTKDPAFAGGWFQVALMDVAAKNFASAVDNFAAALQREETAAAWHGLGQAYFEVGNADSTILCLRRAIDLDPRYTPARVSIASAFSAIGQYDRAETEAREALKYGDDVEPKKLLANLLVNQGRADEAIGILERIRDERPWDAQVQYDAARALQQLGREDEATIARAAFEWNTANDAEIFRLQERIRLTPTNVRDRLELADMYRYIGRTDEALATMYPVMFLVPGNLFIRNNIGVLHLSREEFAQARSYFESGVSADSTFLPARLGLARLELAEGNEARAREHLRIALRVEPGNREAASLLAGIEN